MACAEALPRACITLGRRGSRYTGKRRLAGDTARGIATTDEVKQLRREAQDLKEALGEQALELRLLKKQYGAPVRKWFSTQWSNQSASTYRVSVSIPRPRWRSARTPDRAIFNLTARSVSDHGHNREGNLATRSSSYPPLNSLSPYTVTLILSPASRARFPLKYYRWRR
jgi:hypothetical protein